MPNKMDLEDIKKYLQESVQTGDRQGLNLFMTEPADYCQGMEPVTNEDIKISFLSLSSKQSFAKKNSVFYSVKSPVNIKKVILTLDGQTVKSFIDNSPEIYANKPVDLSAYSDGPHKLGITAIDVNNASKTETLDVLLVSEDKLPPVLDKSQSQILKNEDGSYSVSLMFKDDLSGVKE